ARPLSGPATTRGATFEPLKKPREPPPRAPHAVARARQGDVIAALLGDHAETTLDEREILPVLPEQQGREPVVVESQHDLGCGIVAGSGRGHQRSAVRSR